MLFYLAHCAPCEFIMIFILMLCYHNCRILVKSIMTFYMVPCLFYDVYLLFLDAYASLGPTLSLTKMKNQEVDNFLFCYYLWIIFGLSLGWLWVSSGIALE